MNGYGAFARVYDSLTDDVQYTRMADFITHHADAAGLPRDVITVDLGCGTGNLSLLLREKGYDIIAVDASPMMLNILREKVTEQERILLLCQDLEELDLYGTARLFVCTLDTVNHLQDERSVEMFFQRVGLFCETDGLFIFDVNTAYKHRQILGDNTFAYETEDVLCLWRNALDEQSAQVDISLDLFSPAQNGLYTRDTEEFREYWYSDAFLREVLLKAGFAVLETVDDYTNAACTETTQRRCYVAKKEG